MVLIFPFPERFESSRAAICIIEFEPGRALVRLRSKKSFCMVLIRELVEEADDERPQRRNFAVSLERQ